MNRMRVQVDEIARLKLAGFILDTALQYEIKFAAHVLVLEESVRGGIGGDSISTSSRLPSLANRAIERPLPKSRQDKRSIPCSTKRISAMCFIDARKIAVPLFLLG